MNRFRAGPAGFSVLVAGQGVSLTGSAMASLALSIWLWQSTQSATAMSLATIAYLLPQALLSPIAGSGVDRWGPRRALLIGSGGAAAASLSALVLVLAGVLHPWQLYTLNGITGAFSAVEVPAFTAAMALLVPDPARDRASGLVTLMQNATNILAPVLAGALIVAAGLGGVLTTDLASFAAAVAAILWVRTPPLTKPHPSSLGRSRGIRAAAHIIRAWPLLAHLLGLQLAMATVGAVGMVFLAPLILARSGGDAAAVGLVLGFSCAGGVAGGLIMPTLGGAPARRWGRVRIALTSAGLLSLTGLGLLGVARTVWLLTAAATALTFLLAFFSAPLQALWINAAPPDALGRVTALRHLLVRGATPIVMLAAGPTADAIQAHVTHGGHPAWLHALVGHGPATGMATLFLLAGITGVAAAAGTRSSALRAANQPNSQESPATPPVEP